MNNNFGVRLVLDIDGIENELFDFSVIDDFDKSFGGLVLGGGGLINIFVTFELEFIFGLNFFVFLIGDFVFIGGGACLLLDIISFVSDGDLRYFLNSDDLIIVGARAEGVVAVSVLIAVGLLASDVVSVNFGRELLFSMLGVRDLIHVLAHDGLDFVVLHGFGEVGGVGTAELNSVDGKGIESVNIDNFFDVNAVLFSNTDVEAELIISNFITYRKSASGAPEAEEDTMNSALMKEEMEKTR